MKDIDFFSDSYYLYLPSKINPKVILAIDNNIIAKNSLRLYNPFSKKAKFLKWITSIMLLNFNGLSKLFINSEKYKKSQFIEYLETKLNVTVATSIYNATAKDKVVVQIQSENKVIGYLKFPINKRGVKHLKKEHQAIKILSKKNIVERPILFDRYKSKPYLILRELDGAINRVRRRDLDLLLKKFKEEEKYKLKDHPRVHKLRSKLEKMDLYEYVHILDNTCNSSNEYYHLVNEHGDFAPWNIIKKGQEIIPFDFEYFEKNGLEYLDLIKYYFQVNSLLEKTGIEKTAANIFAEIEIPEIHQLVQIFLMKEIVRKTKESESIIFERDMLEFISNGKA